MKHSINISGEGICFSDGSFEENETPAGPLPSRPQHFANPANPRILIVEDCEDMREFIKICCPHAGQFVEAQNGKQALKLVETDYFDIIISDIEMPVMDGLQFLEEALKSDPSIKNRFLVISSHIDDYMDLLIYFKIRWIKKPLIIEDLQREIGAIIPRSNASDIAHF